MGRRKGVEIFDFTVDTVDTVDEMNQLAKYTYS